MDMLRASRTADMHPLVGHIVTPLWRQSAAWPLDYPAEALVLAVGVDWVHLAPSWPPGKLVPESRCLSVWIPTRDIARLQDTPDPVPPVSDLGPDRLVGIG